MKGYFKLDKEEKSFVKKIVPPILTSNDEFSIYDVLFDGENDTFFLPVERDPDTGVIFYYEVSIDFIETIGSIFDNFSLFKKTAIFDSPEN